MRDQSPTRGSSRRSRRKAVTGSAKPLRARAGSCSARALAPIALTTSAVATAVPGSAWARDEPQCSRHRRSSRRYWPRRSRRSGRPESVAPMDRTRTCRSVRVRGDWPAGLIDHEHPGEQTGNVLASDSDVLLDDAGEPTPAANSGTSMRTRNASTTASASRACFRSNSTRPTSSWRSRPMLAVDSNSRTSPTASTRHRYG